MYRIVGAGVGAAGPLVAEATEVTSFAKRAEILLYVGSDEITLLTLLTNELVSVTPWLAVI